MGPVVHLGAGVAAVPEGHSVHRLARAMNEVFAGVRLGAVSPQGRFSAGAARLDGRVFVTASAVGKHLFVAFRAAEETGAAVETGSAPETAPDFWLHVHLGIYGSWKFVGDETFRAPHAIGAPRRADDLADVHLLRDKSQKVDHETFADRWEAWQGQGSFVPPAPRGAVRLRLVAPNGVADLSGPTTCELVDSSEKAAIEARLGPDPLGLADSLAAGLERFQEGLTRTRRPLGQVLMDQAKIAGVGNIYRAEACFVAQVNPHTRADRVAKKRVAQIWDWLVEQMPRGVDSGRVTTVEPADIPDPLPADDQEAARYYVYRRAGRPCLRCGGTVRLEMAAGRKLYWCPTCQVY